MEKKHRCRRCGRRVDNLTLVYCRSCEKRKRSRRLTLEERVMRPILIAIALLSAYVAVMLASSVRHREAALSADSRTIGVSTPRP